MDDLKIRLLKDWTVDGQTHPPGIYEVDEDTAKELIAKKLATEVIDRRLPPDKSARVPWHKRETEPRTYANILSQGGPLDDGQFEDFDAYLHAVVNKGFGDTRLKTMHSKAVNESVGADGGFLVPDQFVAQLLDRGLESEIVRPRSRSYVMSGNSITVPARTLTDHESSISGATVAWTEEGTSITESTPQVRTIQLRAKKVAGYAKISNEVFEDAAVSMDAVVGGIFSDAISYALDSAFLYGTGANQPLGALSTGNGSLISATRATSDKIEWVDLIGMLEKINPRGRNRRGLWLASSDTIPELYGMSAVGGASTALAPGLFRSLSEASQIRELMGLPLEISERLEALGTAGDVALCDFGEYVIGFKRGSFRILASEHPLLQTDQMAFRITFRCDGQPGWNTTSQGRDNNSYSPFVRLAA